jgi:hypothetical protein
MSSLLSQRSMLAGSAADLEIVRPCLRVSEGRKSKTIVSTLIAEE